MKEYRVTPAQRRYLTEALWRGGHLPRGWGGYSSTRTMRLLRERGYITARDHHCAGVAWCITGIQQRGLDLLGDVRGMRDTDDEGGTDDEGTV
jgi:hypothetical protein